MIPLTMADDGEELIVRKVGGLPETKRHLEDMGFTAGSVISLINRVGGNVIVKVKESRVAINEDLARKIMV